MILSIPPPTLLVKVIILIRLIKLNILGYFWVDVPSLVFFFDFGLVVVVYSRQHPTLIQTLSSMKISDVQFYFCTSFNAFRQNTEIVPVHQAFDRVGVRLEVEVVLEVIIFIISSTTYALIIIRISFISL